MADPVSIFTAISAVASTASAVKSLTSKPKSPTSGIAMGSEEQAKISAEEQDRAKKLAFQQRGRAATRLSGDDTQATGGLATKKLLG